MAEDAMWYVVHTYSGYENAVAAAILKAAENRRMQDLIVEVNIPMETVTELTDNGEKTVERKTYPG
jgi:transcriptional antiterminator NusG